MILFSKVNRVYVVDYNLFDFDVMPKTGLKDPNLSEEGHKVFGSHLYAPFYASSHYTRTAAYWHIVNVFKDYEIRTLCPFRLETDVIHREADVLTKDDILLFTGGEDVGDNHHRDAYEKLVYDMYPHAIKVGICRGAQFLNVMNGGVLVDHIKSNGHVLGHHRVNKDWADTQEFEPMLKGITYLTSTHHQGIIPHPVTATTFVTCPNDGVAEAFCYKGTRCVGIQSHPEYIEAIGGEDTNTLFTRICAASGLFD
jgi:gamma-glutamyl-gamma-aminobutyrate hydrolase PuuD